MNRLQKKCFIASAGFHLLLVVILFVGPAFLSSDDKPAPLEYIVFIPDKLIEANFVRMATQNPQPPAPNPPQQPQVLQPPAPEPPKEKAQEVKPPDPEPVVQKRPKVQINPKIVERKTTSSPTTKEPSRADTQAKERAEKNRTALQSALRTLDQGLSSGTSINIQGPRGESYAGYDIYLQSVYKSHYDRALAIAGDIEDGQAFVEVSVTIARNGSILSARITRPSGNALLDRVVKRVLQEVSEVRPFPEGSKDSQRTFSIVFDLKPKQAIG